ncbi:hypothetical protein SNEBB_000769 [Seison nebaliae]|nr:hypothetical protein SNEBB_000769 [Seison nebaliae]
MPPRIIKKDVSDQFESENIIPDEDQIRLQYENDREIRERKQREINEENARLLKEYKDQLRPKKKDGYQMEIVWRNVILFSLLHIGALIGIRQIFSFSASIYTIIFTIIYHGAGCLGITAGAHRLWSHRTYEAKLPLKIFLAILQTIAFENDIIEWSRDHRVHHKFSETDADPHNAKRGLFFAHMGWLLVKKHPDVKEKGKKIPVNDLMEDLVCVIQRRIYLPAVLFFVFILPTIIPYYFWNESLFNAFYIAALLRYTMTLHATWLVNSVAHFWGMKPYDVRINPTENWFVIFGALGEGFHNYHHTFPQDYSASEFAFFNFTTHFLDLMAKFGLAYNLKKVNPEIIRKRKLRTGMCN